jgi:hypothetical protein
MRIIRVFPRRTNMTPSDDLCIFNQPPGLFIPEHDEVHVVAVFTWDIERARWLQQAWQEKTNRPVRIGGPAMDDPGGDFTPGLYLKPGATITTRGCPNRCSFCLVHKRKGDLRELPTIHPGNIVQDNNLLAASRPHLRKVFDMLRSQHQIRFLGGIEAARVTDEIVDEMRNLRIKDIWMACDSPGAIGPLRKAVEKFRAGGFHQKEILRAYVLCGDDMEENENRCRQVFEMGVFPFAILFQPPTLDKIAYSKEWKALQKRWERPAASKAHMRKVKLGGNP